MENPDNNSLVKNEHQELNSSVGNNVTNVKHLIVQAENENNDLYSMNSSARSSSLQISSNFQENYSESETIKPQKRKSMIISDESSSSDIENNNNFSGMNSEVSNGDLSRRSIYPEYQNDEFDKSDEELEHKKKRKETKINKKRKKPEDFDEGSSDDHYIPENPKKSKKSSKSSRVKSEESLPKKSKSKSTVKKEIKQIKTEDELPKKVKKELTVKSESSPVKKQKIRVKKEDLSQQDDVKKSGRKKMKKEEEEAEKWEWWKEEPHPDGALWLTLEHNGPYFPPLYQPLPSSVKFLYDGKEMKLSSPAEEVASFYAKMLDHEYTSKDIFNKNFFGEWRKMMTSEEKAVITDLKKCDFKPMSQYFLKLTEEKKAMTKEQKEAIKEENQKIVEAYGYCMLDGHKQKVGNFRIEPPGLFRGRGDHPKQGKLKLRVQPEDVIINIGENAKIPQPPEGHSWKSIQHDNKVSWLASWVENISGSHKYVMLNPTAKIKGEKDMAKFDIARQLRNHIDVIRDNYKKDWESEDMNVAQRAVCLYFIDKLALRAGHEKEEGDSADTVGCCSLRVEHIKLHKEFEDQKYVVEFDFLGKDSIRYINKVSVKKKVFRNLRKFQQGKKPGTDLFDKLTTTSLNKYLSELMPGLTAKVFRTYNASSTLQEQLQSLTDPKQNVNEKILSYNRANRAVAILCNHQRSVPKTFTKTMENLSTKMSDKKKDIKKLKKEIAEMKSDGKANTSSLEKAENKMKRLKEQLIKLDLMATEKDENKTVALGTSKLNYLDPRITIAWCRKFDVPIEKVFTKTHREKFQWAIDMTDETFVF